MSREYEVELTRTAEKELKRLHPRVRGQVRQRLLELERDPRPQDVKRVRGAERPPWPGAGRARSAARRRLEERERLLSPHAATSFESRGRETPEEPSPVRPEVQRDRDRILPPQAL